MEEVEFGGDGEIFGVEKHDEDDEEEEEEIEITVKEVIEVGGGGGNGEGGYCVGGYGGRRRRQWSWVTAIMVVKAVEAEIVTGVLVFLGKNSLCVSRGKIEFLHFIAGLQ